MPRYFFDVSTDQRKHRDEVGIDLSGLDAAAAETFELLRDLIQDEMPEGVQEYVVNIRDDRNVVVYSGKMTVQGRRF